MPDAQVRSFDCFASRNRLRRRTREPIPHRQPGPQDLQRLRGSASPASIHRHFRTRDRALRRSRSGLQLSLRVPPPRRTRRRRAGAACRRLRAARPCPLPNHRHALPTAERPGHRGHARLQARSRNCAPVRQGGHRSSLQGGRDAGRQRDIGSGRRFRHPGRQPHRCAT